MELHDVCLEMMKVHDVQHFMRDTLDQMEILIRDIKQYNAEGMTDKQLADDLRILCGWIAKKLEWDEWR